MDARNTLPYAAILEDYKLLGAYYPIRRGMKVLLGARFCLAIVLSGAFGFALPPTIGIASAIGTFVVNSNQVDGNANLFEGSEIRTGKASSQIFLQNGAALTLGISSAGTVYRDHVLLQEGATKIDNMNGYSVHAADYRVEQAQPASQAVVRMNGDMVEIAALAGSLNVLDRSGALLTRLGSGTATAFQAGGTGGNGGQGSANPNNNNRVKYRTATALLLAGTLAGLGLAVVAITQPSPTSH